MFTDSLNPFVSANFVFARRPIFLGVKNITHDTGIIIQHLNVKS